MTVLRKILRAALIMGTACGIAGATTITTPITTSTPVALTKTDWNSTLAFAQFDSTLGTLTAVSIDLSSSLQTVLTITNGADASSNATGHVDTELMVSIEDAGNLLGFTNPPSNSQSSVATIDILSPGFFIGSGGLAPGASITSGTITASCGDGSACALNQAIFGPLVYTDPAILGEFSNAGGGTVSLNAGTFTQTVLFTHGGNVTGSQSTFASLTGTVTYTYDTVTTPEPASMLLMGSALLGVGLLKKRFARSH